MRTSKRNWLGAVVGVALLAGAGCAKVPNCTVSPIEIEETREDVKVLDRNLSVARDRAKKLGADLARLKTELDGKKDKPKKLRRKLDDLKKGSGRDDKDEKDGKESA